MYYYIQPPAAGTHMQDVVNPILNPQETFQLNPKMDIIENGKEVIYLFEMPGVNQDAINVEVRDNLLYIDGEISMEAMPHKDHVNYVYREREGSQKYSRLLSLPAEVDYEQADASIRNGLLSVRFPLRKGGRRLLVKQQQQYEQQPQQVHHQINPDQPYPQQGPGH